MSKSQSQQIVHCIFCDTDGSRSDEHLWPDWIGKRLPQRGSVSLLRLQENGRWSRRKGIAYTQRITDVCRNCNGGWMKALEDNVIPIAEPMIFGMKAVSLDHRDQQLLAAWVYLRTLIVQRAADPDGLSIRRYREFFDLKDRPPDSSFLWVGGSSNPHLDNAYFSSATLDYATGKTEFFAKQAPPEAYVATLAVGGLAMRSFLYSPLMRVSGAIAQVRNGDYDPYLVPIWVPTPQAEKWPPSRVFDVAELDRLVQTLPTTLTGR